MKGEARAHIDITHTLTHTHTDGSQHNGPTEMCTRRVFAWVPCSPVPHRTHRHLMCPRRPYSAVFCLGPHVFENRPLGDGIFWRPANDCWRASPPTITRKRLPPASPQIHLGRGHRPPYCERSLATTRPATTSEGGGRATPPTERPPRRARLRPSSGDFAPNREQR